MNPHLGALNPYPFERLKKLLGETTPTPTYASDINLSIGEPKHAAPALVKQAIGEHLSGLSQYPPTKGNTELRTSIAQWISKRYGIPLLDAETQVLPCNGSREALFAFAQTVIDPTANAVVVCPNPFYQIYEGAAILGGATPYFVNADPAHNFAVDWHSVPAEVWQRTQLLYVCSPNNPTGNVMPMQEWQRVFELADEYNFVIASDECYSEIYFDNHKPIGALEAASRLGRSNFKNIVIFSSLSKRSNVPGMRSGFIVGDAKLLKDFLLYRTYHGSAMSLVVSHASMAAWNDEQHVIENRRIYQEKFAQVYPILKSVLDVKMPDASFYLWAGTPVDDADFVKQLYIQSKVTLLPGSYLARTAHGFNPGHKRVRIALVAPLEDCVEGAQRIADFVKSNY